MSREKSYVSKSFVKSFGSSCDSYKQDFKFSAISEISGTKLYDRTFFKLALPSNSNSADLLNSFKKASLKNKLNYIKLDYKKSKILFFFYIIICKHLI